MSYKVKDEILKVCEVTISYRPTVRTCDRPVLKSSMDIYTFLMQNGVFNPDTVEYREYFKILLLNNANKMLGVQHLSEGSIGETPADVRHIMQAAILANATGIVLCHNHTSGKCSPSRNDDLVTAKVKDAGELFDIRILDHLIISPYSYYSYADEGKIL